MYLSTNIHYVTEIQLGEIENLGSGTIVRKIVIKCKDNDGQYELYLFGDKKEDLQIDISRNIVEKI